MSNTADLDAGVFSSWLEEMQGALRGDHGADVPCGECTACCTSSQFIHIAPDETDTLAHIPRALLFPAPHMPRGHVLMGYDEHGRCPMLIENRCSIYAHRPRTCRTYDCRVFAAAGLEPADDKPLIAVQVRRWRFRHPTERDRVLHEAVTAAAADRDDPSADGPDSANATRRAIHAVETCDADGVPR